MIVLWRITEACNLSCGFCAYDKRLKRTRRTASAEQVQRGLALFEAFAQQRRAPVHISWLGGEPLLWRPLEALMAHYARREHLRFSATTNGTRLGDLNTRRFILDQFSELTVSVDALAQTHDRLRGEAGLWHQTRDSVRSIAAVRQPGRPKLRVNTVLMRSTLPEFPALCDALTEWGIDEITFNALGGRDRPEFFPAECLTPDDWAAFRQTLPALRQSLAASNIHLSGSAAYLDRIAASAAGERFAVDDCQPGTAHLFIETDGCISPCHVTSAEYGVNLADLQSAGDIARLPGVFRTARRDTPSVQCADCVSTRVFGKFAA